MKAIELSYCHHSICLKKRRGFIKKYQNWMKNARVMPIVAKIVRYGLEICFAPYLH